MHMVLCFYFSSFSSLKRLKFHINMNLNSSLIILGNFVVISYAGNLVYLLVCLAPISMCHLDTIKKKFSNLTPTICHFISRCPVFFCCFAEIEITYLATKLCLALKGFLPFSLE